MRVSNEGREAGFENYALANAEDDDEKSRQGTAMRIHNVSGRGKSPSVESVHSITFIISEAQI